jgi:hypothetical protein
VRRVTLKTRKPCDRLWQSDLAAFPIWEFADDEEAIPGRDETWVRPLNRRTIARSRSVYAVAAKFTLANSLQFNGVAWIETFEEEPTIQGGAILYNRRYLSIPGKVDLQLGVYDRILNNLAEEVRVNNKDIFPISIDLAVRIQGESDLRRFVLDR